MAAEAYPGTLEQAIARAAVVRSKGLEEAERKKERLSMWKLLMSLRDSRGMATWRG